MAKSTGGLRYYIWDPFTISKKGHRGASETEQKRAARLKKAKRYAAGGKEVKGKELSHKYLVDIKRGLPCRFM